MAVAAVLEKAKTTTKRKATTTKGRKAIKGATSRIPAKDQKKLDSCELLEINGATYSFEVKWTRHVKANPLRGIAAKPKRQYKLYNFCPISGSDGLKDKLEGLVSDEEFELETKLQRYFRRNVDKGLYQATLKVSRDESWALEGELIQIFELKVKTEISKKLNSSPIYQWCVEHLVDVTYREAELRSKLYPKNLQTYTFVHIPIVGYNNIEVGMIAFTVMQDLTLGNDRVTLYNKAAHHLV